MRYTLFSTLKISHNLSPHSFPTRRSSDLRSSSSTSAIPTSTATAISRRRRTSVAASWSSGWAPRSPIHRPPSSRSEEHTSELQSHSDLVCRLVLDKNKVFNHLHTKDERLY